MNDDTLLAILRLQKSKAIGDILAKKLIATSGGVEHIFEQKKTTLEKIQDNKYFMNLLKYFLFKTYDDIQKHPFEHRKNLKNEKINLLHLLR